MSNFNFYEFFAGGGMARAGLGSSNWRCLFANDFDYKKSRIYVENWGDDVLKTADVRNLRVDDLPEYADLVWASFPCQDLSLAGSGAGLKGDRSGTFWPFWHLMQSLIAQGRGPKMIVLENVCGTITSHEGQDFTSICTSLKKSGYRFGALVIDAALFLPQSRPRLFIIGVSSDIVLPHGMTNVEPVSVWHSRTLRSAVEKLPTEIKEHWLWWNLPIPTPMKCKFADLIEDEPQTVSWHSMQETERILQLMAPIHRAKVEQVQKSGVRTVGTIYKRTRANENGIKTQRAEVRFDNIAGCLRTPVGGSSRQLILVIEGSKVRSRLISSRETARLMGLPDTYILPDRYNEAYHLTGDGVAVPVVRHLAAFILEPLLYVNVPILQKAA